MAQSLPMSDLDDGLDTDLRARLKEELEPGERLLWAGRSQPIPEPISTAYFWWSGIALILFVLGVLACFRGRHGRWFDNNSPSLLGIFLIGIACFIVMVSIATWFGRQRENRRKANFLYAVTDRRAIVWAPEPRGDAVRIRTIERGQIQSLERVQRKDGSGDLFFSTATHAVPVEDFGWNPFAFTHIHDVRRVEQIVRNNLISTERTT